MDSVRKEKSGWQNLFYVVNGHLKNYCTSVRKGGNTFGLLDFFYLNAHTNKYQQAASCCKCKFSCFELLAASSSLSFCVETMWNTKNQGKGVFSNVVCFMYLLILVGFFQKRYSIDSKTN